MGVRSKVIRCQDPTNLCAFLLFQYNFVPSRVHPLVHDKVQHSDTVAGGRGMGDSPWAPRLLHSIVVGSRGPMVAALAEESTGLDA